MAQGRIVAEIEKIKDGKTGEIIREEILYYEEFLKIERRRIDPVYLKLTLEKYGLAIDDVPFMIRGSYPLELSEVKEVEPEMPVKVDPVSSYELKGHVDEKETVKKSKFKFWKK